MGSTWQKGQHNTQQSNEQTKDMDVCNLQTVQDLPYKGGGGGGGGLGIY